MKHRNLDDLWKKEFLVIQRNISSYHGDLTPSLTSTVRFTTIARSELSLAASLCRSCIPLSTKALDFPEFVGTQATRVGREARLLLCRPDLEAEVASLLAELLRVVTSANGCEHAYGVEWELRSGGVSRSL